VASRRRRFRTLARVWDDGSAPLAGLPFPRASASRLGALKMTTEQAKKLEDLAKQKTGDPHLDSMKAVVLTSIVRERLG
jgi:hypothetical protein